MGWGWIPALVTAVLAVIKGLFGIDKPQENTIHETPPPLPPPDPADVLRDLGIAPDANGATGGTFPTAPAADDGMHDRAHGRDTARLHSPRATPASDDERESER